MLSLGSFQVEERLKSHLEGVSSGQLHKMSVFVKGWTEHFNVNNDPDVEGVEGWAKMRRFRGGLRTVAVASVMWCNTGGIIVKARGMRVIKAKETANRCRGR